MKEIPENQQKSICFNLKRDDQFTNFAWSKFLLLNIPYDCLLSTTMLQNQGDINANNGCPSLNQYPIKHYYRKS